MRKLLVSAALILVLIGTIATAANYRIPSSTMLPVPAVQTIAAGNIIAADKCGGLKLIDAGGAVSTDATNAFTASTDAGCYMHVCNTSSGANTITIKHSANVLTSTGADLALAQNGCVTFGSNGSKWYQLVTMLTNS